MGHYIHFFLDKYVFTSDTSGKKVKGHAVCLLCVLSSLSVDIFALCVLVRSGVSRGSWWWVLVRLRLAGH